MQLAQFKKNINQASSFATRHLFFCVISLLFFSFSVLVLSINATYTHYVGNNYFPVSVVWITTALILIYLGFCLQYHSTHHLTQRVQELFLFFGSMALIILGSNAIQFTPFSPIDHQILRWGEWMHVDFTHVMTWSHAHPTLYTAMEWIYASLTYQLTYLPLILIILGRFERLHEYYFLLLFTALIGYGFYYFFPTTAPASVIDSPYFTEAQHATELKFKQIHHHIKPTTLEGGMIALPSFHVIWAWLCVWLVRDWKWAFRALLLLNVSMVISCVLLGWHYILDIVASMIILAFAHGVQHYSRRT
ncbi:MAG: phosphatase PAP2 family protein [Legionellaceae bacterium]|nr:phosphatase PAP2 family protein [Legionellaceae bacterium]